MAPNISLETLREAEKVGMPMMRGVATPSEPTTALSLGGTWTKAFPAAQLGVGSFTAMHGPFPEARLVAVGGVTPASAKSYLEAGAEAVGIGSALDPAPPTIVGSMKPS